MSGVAGVYYRDGDGVDQTELEAFSRSLAHRAVDGSSTLEEDPIGFTHQQFHTTPEAVHEELPRAEHGLAITADARIDNRDDLLSRLSLRDCSEVVTDSDIILEAYREWGIDAPNELVGAFVFAIWDADAERLVCARDHTGLRPLYYSLDERRFLFASEPGGLLSRDDVPNTADEVRIGDYLSRTVQDRERTFYSEIKRLPPATTVTITADDVSKSRYWELDTEREIELDSDEAYARAFREHFEEAVRCRLRTDGPVGTFLSGGLDSSSVTCVANEYLRERGVAHETFSVVFDEVPESDEREFIEPVLRECTVRSTFVKCDDTGPLTGVREMLDATDEPFTAHALYLHWELYRSVADADIDVVLGGYGGDITVSYGLRRFVELALDMDLVELKSELSAFASMFDRSTRDVFVGYVLSPLLPDSIKDVWHTLRRDGQSTEFGPMLDEDFVDDIGLKQRRERIETGRTVAKTERERQYRALEDGVTVADIETVNKVSAVHSIDHRHPFLDKRLIEFCLALPADQKLRNGWSRYVLRRAMNQYLPSEVQWRKWKTSYTKAFRRNLRECNEGELREAIEKHEPSVEPYVDIDEYENAYTAALEGQEGEWCLDLWLTCVLAFWAETLE